MNNQEFLEFLTEDDMNEYIDEKLERDYPGRFISNMYFDNEKNHFILQLKKKRRDEMALFRKKRGY